MVRSDSFTYSIAGSEGERSTPATVSLTENDWAAIDTGCF
jgi:hypothetical protein